VSVSSRIDRRFVNLGFGLDKGCEPRGTTEQKDEQPGSERIECAEVANAALTINPSHVLDDIVRRHSRGLVD